MKHATILWGALLAIPVCSPAGAQVRVGLISGVNRTRYEAPNDDAAHSSRTRYAVGGVVDFSLADVFGLRAEPMFIQKGGSAHDVPGDRNTTLRTSMLEVPVLASVGFGETTRPYLVAGPTFAVVLSTRIVTASGGIRYEGDLDAVTPRLEMSAGVGGGLSHDFGHVAGFVESRYVWGLTNLMENGDVAMSAADGAADAMISFDHEIHRYRFRGLQVLVGLTVPLGSH